MIFAGMLLMGALLGFVGAGGSGMTIALLVSVYKVPMHTALAVAITAMIFTMLSGTISHLREGEVEVRLGLLLGISGMVGAFLGANVANVLPTRSLHILTGSVMLASSVVMYFRLYRQKWLERHIHIQKKRLTGQKRLVCGITTGVFLGFISGAFGIGATAFIQLALLIIFGLPLLQSIGTCMLVILPISLAGSFGYILNGRLDTGVFLQTFLGLVIGSFIGAKFTHIAPRSVLQAVIVMTPLFGGLVILAFR